jgi:hypothetical protein
MLCAAVLRRRENRSASRAAGWYLQLAVSVVVRPCAIEFSFSAYYSITYQLCMYFLLTRAVVSFCVVCLRCVWFGLYGSSSVVTVGQGLALYQHVYQYTDAALRLASPQRAAHGEGRSSVTV